MHFLDLPVLARRPPEQALAAAVRELEPEKTRDFEAHAELDRGVRQWLARLSVADLDWIDADAAEALRSAAAQRLALECGVAAGSSNVREVELPSIGLADALTGGVPDGGLTESTNASLEDQTEPAAGVRAGSGSPDGTQATERSVVVRLREPGLVEDHLGRLTWGSSLVLARRLMRTPQLVRGRRVLELGAGTGLCGIAAALAGAEAVDVTDLPEIVPNLAENLEENVAALPCRAYVLDWSYPPENLAGFDVCIVSDPVYSREHPPLLLNAVASVNARVVLLQLPLRPTFEAERDQIFTGLASQGYACLDSATEPGRDLFGEQTFLYRYYEKHR